MIDQPQSFGEVRREAMKEAESDALLIRSESPGPGSVEARGGETASASRSSAEVREGPLSTPLAIVVAVALVLGVLGAIALYGVSVLRDEVNNLRQEMIAERAAAQDRIEIARDAAQQAATEAIRVAERAFQAQQSAAINREYAVQVVSQLNRMGYPVMSPGEKDHPLAQPEDYAKLDAFAKQQQEKQP